MRFSERIGKRPIKTGFQIDSMDGALRNRLWSILRTNCFRLRHHDDDMAHNPQLRAICDDLWDSFWKYPLDSVPHSSSEAVGQLRAFFFECDWSEVYDFVEFVVTNPAYYYIKNEMIAECNRVLEEELSGYRFVAGRLVPVSAEQEVQAIEHAINETSTAFPGASQHLRTAIDLLAKKPKPDYRNSIKESISAVESLCITVTGEAKATLGKALKAIGSKAELHGALVGAFEKLYGYTSDADGIRHALLSEDHLEQEDAVFMLVACSAFVNYVIAKSAKKQ